MSKYASMDFSKLLTDIDTVQPKKTFEKDEAFWKPTKDKFNNATALIRFLPSKIITDIPFARLYKHNFKDVGTGRWYIENSLTTIGGQDLVSTVNKELWENNAEGSDGRKLASLRKRKLSFIANILVIKDLGNPENNGKVFKYAFGAKIMEKIVGASKPSEVLDEETGDVKIKESVSAFDPINGADFMLKMNYNESMKQYNYDSSFFNSKKAMFNGDDDKIDAVMAQCHDIQLEVSPDKFKTPEVLADKFLWVIGEKKPAATGAAKAAQKEFDEGDAELAELAKIAAEPAKVEKKKVSPPPIVDVGNDDDDAAFFASLAGD